MRYTISDDKVLVKISSVAISIEQAIEFILQNGVQGPDIPLKEVQNRANWTIMMTHETGMLIVMIIGYSVTFS